MLRRLAIPALFLVSCSGTTNTVGYAPVTGIIIRSDALVKDQGCGRGADQVFQYAAILRNKKRNGDRFMGDPFMGDPARRYDCFSDAIYSDLKPEDGSLDFDLEVYAFNQAAATAVTDTCVRPGLPNQVCGIAQDDLRKIDADPTGSKRRWSTRCMATQQQDVEVLAVCAPLLPQ